MPSRHITALLSLLVLALLGAALAQNTCRDSAACCRVFDFEAPAGNTAAPFAADTVAVAAGNASLWSSAGLAFSVDERPSAAADPYPLGLFNTSRVPALAITGADLLHALGANLVLSTFDRFDSALLRKTQLMRMRLLQQPACVATVSTLRSITTADHSSVTMYTMRISGTTNSTVQYKSFAYSVADSSNANAFEFSALNIDELVVEWTGLGYGALASVEVCYHAPRGYDACGVCAGDNTGCAEPGSACTTGLGGACAAGTYDAQLQCVPNLAAMPEQCNGLDDNCDGIVDNGDFGTWACGVGACARNISRCQAGALVNASACVPGTPTPEVCNGVDDDCDGIVDNGNVCVSPSASARPTPSVTPSASAAPAHPLLLPRATCVRPLGAAPADGYEAHFGYWLTGVGAVDVDLPAGGASNTLLRNGAPVADAGQPTHFVAGAPVAAAFAVPLSLADSLEWRLALPGQPVQSALLDAGAPACSADAPLTLEAVQPLFQGCVTMLGGRCSVALAYVNPNPQTVALPAGAANRFAPEPADRRQPQLFAPGKVERVQTLDFDCADPNWSLTWSLTLGAQTRTARVTSANIC